MHILFKLSLTFIFLISMMPSHSEEWQRINMGGGGAMNIAGAGPSGTIVVGTDLAGAYIRKLGDDYWRMLGPNNGIEDTHVTGVAFDNSDQNIILISTEGGIYRSADEGEAFSRVDRALGSSTYFGGKFLALAYQKTTNSTTNRRVYASRISNWNTPDGQILRSNDGGQSFTATAALPNTTNTVITKIVIHPNNPSIVLALSNEERFFNDDDPDTAPSPHNALYMSTNAGDSWVEVAQNIQNISDVVFHPTAPYPVYISNTSGVDSANIFTCGLNTSSDTCSTSTSIASISGEGPPLLILWPDATSSTKIRAININTAWSHDADAAWRISFTNNTWQPPVGLGESSDWAGSESNWQLGWSKNNSIFNPNLESVNHTIGFDMSNPNAVFWTTDQFIFEGFDQGGNALAFYDFSTSGSEASGWSSTGIDNITPFILNVNRGTSAGAPDIIYAGLNDLGCTASFNAGYTWSLCAPYNSDGNWGDGFADPPHKTYGGTVTALISDPHDAANVWVFSASDQSNPVELKKSTDYGQSWSVINVPNLPSTNKIYGLSMYTSDTDVQRLFVTINGQVYRSENGGTDWSMVYSCASGCRTTEVSMGGVVYAGGEEGLFVSKSNGAPSTWERVLSKAQIDGINTGDLFDRDDWKGISGISIDPHNDNIVYVAAFSDTTAQGVYKCDVTGTVNTDNDCGLILENKAFVRDVTVDPINTLNIYAASSSAYTSGGYISGSGGVYRSTDGGVNKDWPTMNAGLDWPMAITIQVSPSNSNTLYLGSPGGGNYRIDLQGSSLGQPQLIAPIGFTSTNPPVFSWQRVPGATSYLLFANEYSDTDVPGKINITYTASEAGCVTNAICQVSPNVNFDNAEGEWWITAISDTTSSISEAGYFFVTSAFPPIATTLLTPNGNINDNTPTYIWNAIPDSSWYYLWVNDSSGNRIKTWYTAVEANCGSGIGTCSVTPSVQLVEGNGTWWVQTWNTAGAGPWSAAQTYHLNSSTPPPAVTLISPTGAISDNTPSYSWNAAPNSSWYYLWVDDSTGNRIKKWYTATEAGCGSGVGICSVTHPTALTNGAGQWWVQTWNSVGYGAWSNSSGFTLN